MALQFTRTKDGPSIEEYIKYQKGQCSIMWYYCLKKHLVDVVFVWWNSISNKEQDKIMTLPKIEIEQIFLDIWSHARRKTMGLFSCTHSLLQVQGCIKKIKVIISINPSLKYNFIHVDLAKRLRFQQRIYVEIRLLVSMFKFLEM